MQLHFSTRPSETKPPIGRTNTIIIYKYIFGLHKVSYNNLQFCHSPGITKTAKNKANDETSRELRNYYIARIKRKRDARWSGLNVMILDGYK